MKVDLCQWLLYVGNADLYIKNVEKNIDLFELLQHVAGTELLVDKAAVSFILKLELSTCFW